MSSLFNFTKEKNQIRMNKLILVSSLILVLLGTACVPARKYEELEDKYKKSIADSELYKTNPSEMITQSII